MLNELNWITVKERADFHSTCLIYKCQNNLAHQYLVDHFNNISESHDMGPGMGQYFLGSKCATKWYLSIREGFLFWWKVIAVATAMTACGEGVFSQSILEYLAILEYLVICW